MTGPAGAVAIVQARVGSRRLPGKVLQKIGDRTMLERVVERVRRARSVTRVVVATSDASGDDAVEALCAERAFDVFRGSESDVLGRYVGAAARFGADPVVRITADCPLIDPGVIDRVVGTFQEGGFDYVANINPPSYPHGLDTEILSAEALRRADRDASWRSEREHVTLHVRNHPESFRIGNVTNPVDLSGRRWVVDEASDLEMVRIVYSRLGDGPFGMDDVLALLDRDSDVERVNAGIPRDVGLKKSLAEDGQVR